MSIALAATAFASRDKPVIGLSLDTLKEERWQRDRDTFTAEAKKLGADVIVQSANSNDTVQVRDIESLISRGVDVLVIVPHNGAAMTRALLKANEAKIPVINLDNRIDAAAAAGAGLKVAAFVGPDNVEGARLSCQELVRRLGGDARVAILEGIPAAVNAQQRKQGCVEIITQTADAKLVASQTANWELDQANTVFTDTLQAHPDINALFAANDMMALGAMQAIKAAGRSGQIVVAGYDNIDAAQQALRGGTMAATVDQHPERIGAEGVRAAARLLKGESVPAEIPIQVELITKEKLR